MQDNDFIQRACKAVEDAKVVSFDIFDTLLLRPYVSPKDLFLHVEEQYGCVGFRDERVDAERRCREKNNNLQDIRANSNMRCDSFKSLMIINKLSKFL